MKKIAHNGSTTGYFVTMGDHKYTNFAQPNGNFMSRLAGSVVDFFTRIM